MKNVLTLIVLLLIHSGCYAQDILIEAESFDNPGGWTVDPQFEQQMGSPFLSAHGIGEPVKNASTKVKFESNGEYHVWVRTKTGCRATGKPPGNSN